MKKTEGKFLQEIILGSIEKAESKRISYALKKGTIKKIAPKIYTSNFNDSPQIIIKRNWFRILAAQYPQALLSHRTALECKPTPAGHIYLSKDVKIN